MELVICVAFVWLFILTIWAGISMDLIKLDIGFLKDDVTRLERARGRQNARHRELKESIRKAVTDD